MRRDAARRREHLITTACELFRIHSHEVPLETIAATAGVGIATLYRNFPDRQALLHACGTHMFTQVIDLQKDVLSRFAHTPHEAWESYATTLISMGVGSMVATFAPDDLSALPEDVARLRADAIEQGEKIMAHAAEYRFVPSDLSHTRFMAGLLTLGRPPAPGIAALEDNLTDYLVATYLAGLARTAR